MCEVIRITPISTLNVNKPQIPCLIPLSSPLPHFTLGILPHLRFSKDLGTVDDQLANTIFDAFQVWMSPDAGVNVGFLVDEENDELAA